MSMTAEEETELRNIIHDQKLASGPGCFAFILTIVAIMSIPFVLAYVGWMHQRVEHVEKANGIEARVFWDFCRNGMKMKGGNDANSKD